MGRRGERNVEGAWLELRWQEAQRWLSILILDVRGSRGGSDWLRLGRGPEEVGSNGEEGIVASGQNSKVPGVSVDTRLEVFLKPSSDLKKVLEGSEVDPDLSSSEGSERGDQFGYFGRQRL